MSLFVPYAALRKRIEDDGWNTPNTYGKEFSPIEDAPAVYLFLLAENLWFERGLVAYVGMSKRLIQRISNHPIMSEIEDDDRHVSTWFKRVPVPELRSVERKYIRLFNPPWNVQGKVRGLGR